MNHKDHWKWLADFGCVVCGAPATIHHCKGGSMIDWFGSNVSPRGTRCNHFLVIPLCVNHHTGNDGIDQMPVREWESRFGTQVGFLIWVNANADISIWEESGLPDPCGYAGPEAFQFAFKVRDLERKMGRDT